jgi:quinol monooxygenase YgiN
MHRTMMKRFGLASAAALLAIGAATLSISGAARDAGPGSAGLMVRIAELEIDPAQLDAYKALLAEEQEASVRLEPGVLMLHSVALADSPTSIRLLEVYASRSAYEAHIQSPHFVKYKTSTETMVKSLRLVDTTPILLCAKARGPAGGPATC